MYSGPYRVDVSFELLIGFAIEFQWPLMFDLDRIEIMIPFVSITISTEKRAHGVRLFGKLFERKR